MKREVHHTLSGKCQNKIFSHFNKNNFLGEFKVKHFISTQRSASPVVQPIATIYFVISLFC